MRSIILTFLLLSSIVTKADTITIPINRMFFHDKIAAEQKLIDKLDGKADQEFHAVNNNDINMILTFMLYKKVKETTDWIETTNALPANNDKVKYLTYVEQMLRQFRTALRNRELTPVEFSSLYQAFHKALYESSAKRSYVYLLQELSYPSARIIADIITDNPYNTEAKEVVYLKFCEQHPEKILQTIRPWVEKSFADSLLELAARNNPAQLYSYAQSTSSPEGKLIHNSKRPVIKAIADLSQTKNALFFFPFLDDLMSGKKQVAEIQKFVGDGKNGYDSIGYFNLLVETEIAYYKRLAPPLRDTPIAMFGANGLLDMLHKKTIEHFITPINELHNLSNIQTRMKAIEPLNAQALYYVLIMGENEIYTSSFKHAFSRLLQQMGTTPRGDELLMSVHFDHFRKFIKMAAHYNKLDVFLKTMPSQSADLLMKAFVANLDRTSNLEDAVDVADAYSSITDTTLLKSILLYVEENYEMHVEEGNDRGKLIYGLLKEIFHSADPTKKVDLTATLGIPSIYEINNKQLQNEEGKIIQQVFFYGDEDGKVFFPAFVNTFSSKDWKIIPKKEWIEFISLNGKAEVYVNRPLDNDTNLDDSAQVHLIQYLENAGKFPSVIVHRGHSYWLPRTISRMSPGAKIILLGSCGGYKNLNEILGVCPEAHIISTKEIGKGDLNQPIINFMNSKFINGKDIVWRDMWRSLTDQFSGAPKTTRESWEDYIPPYRNLGAIFIKAYHRKIQSE